jgi:hypothetical protein
MGNEVLELEKAVLELLNDAGCVKIISCVDDGGAPYAAVKDSLQSDGENIVYLEFLESSKTNRYVTRALWFDKKVSVLLLAPDKKSFLISARPVRAVVSGKYFQEFYAGASRKYGLDLAAVWILKPEKITEQTLKKRIEEEAAARPYFIHLDRLKKHDTGNSEEPLSGGGFRGKAAPKARCAFGPVGANRPAAKTSTKPLGKNDKGQGGVAGVQPPLRGVTEARRAVVRGEASPLFP